MLKKIKQYILAFCKNIKRTFFSSTRQKNVHKWRTEKGDETLRINYDLDENSIVFDVGGYIGD